MRKMLILVLALVVITGISAQVTATGSSDPDCPGSLPNQLAIGMRGQITADYSTLRAEMDGTSTIIRAPARFTVLDAPQCAPNNSLWWLHIVYDDGQEGWASESQVVSIYGYAHYWLEPVTVPESFG